MADKGSTSIILCGNLIDGTGASPLRDAFIRVQGGLVAQVGEQASLSLADTKGAVDLSQCTVLPGLIDCHDHLGFETGDVEETVASELDTWTVLKAARKARSKLMAGVTTVRDCGEKNYIDVVLKKAINEGVMPGPRLLISGRWISRTGGPGWCIADEVDGANEARSAVRRQVKAGADMIKVFVSGALSTRSSDPTFQDMCDDELQGAVDEAHRLGRKVAAHAYGGQAATAAITAGVDSIEHGPFLREEQLSMMVERGTFLVPTVGVYRVGSEAGVYPEFMLSWLRDTESHCIATLALARKSGVKVALGTDAGHIGLVDEMEALVEARYTPMEAICAATAAAAELCGLSDTLGTVQAGKYADLLAVDGDPLLDLAALRRVHAVWKGGVVQEV